MWQASFSISELANYLAEATPFENIRRYLFDAGISEVNIHLPESKRNAWFNVVSEAQKMGKVIDLLEAIKADYQQGSIFDQLVEFQEAYWQEYPDQRPATEVEETSEDTPTSDSPLPYPFDSPKAHAMQIKVTLTEVYQEPLRALDALRNMLGIHDNLGNILEQMLYLSRWEGRLKEMQTQIINQMERWNNSQLQVSRGIIPEDQFQLEENRIRSFVMDTLDQMQTELSSAY